MLRKMLLAIFCWKLNHELEQFSKEMEGRSRAGIIASAYRIDSMFMIYGLLLEMAPAMTGEELDALNREDGILELFYQDWLQVPDSRNDEMLKFLIDEKRKCLARRMMPVKEKEGYAA